jgi:hypothetical protein
VAKNLIGVPSRVAFALQASGWVCATHRVGQTQPDAVIRT